MGSSQSYPGLTEDLLEDYKSLTYLSRGEILHIMKKFSSIDSEKLKADYHHRFSKQELIEKFKVLKNNPFQDRIFKVFSSKNDDCFSFEDMLDLCSAMSADCPVEVKAAWAFKIFDLDGDNQISSKDICNIIERLTSDPNNHNQYIEDFDKMNIANTILEEIKLDSTGSIGLSEFKILLTRIPEFETSFYFRV